MYTNRGFHPGIKVKKVISIRISANLQPEIERALTSGRHHDSLVEPSQKWPKLTDHGYQDIVSNSAVFVVDRHLGKQKRF